MSDRNPYLLCDFHMHTTWSDGALTLRDLVDLYGRTGDVDVIAITDHILREKDWLGCAGRLATLGRRTFSVTEKTFPAYLEAIREEAERAWREYELLVIPGAEVTKNHARARKNAHIVALGIERFISADQSPEDILREIRHSWKTLIRAEKDWESIKDALRSNVDIAITLYPNGAWNRKDKKFAKGAPAAVPAPAAS